MDLAIIAAAIGLFVLIFSAGLSLGASLARPSWSAARKSLLSAGLGAGLPMLVPFGGLFTEIGMLWNGEASDFLLGLAALLILTLVLAAVAGLPGAWMVTRLFADHAEAPSLEGDETPLLA